jgi:hypothetical protein
VPIRRKADMRLSMKKRTAQRLHEDARIVVLAERDG